MERCFVRRARHTERLLLALFLSLRFLIFLVGRIALLTGIVVTINKTWHFGNVVLGTG